MNKKESLTYPSEWNDVIPSRQDVPFSGNIHVRVTEDLQARRKKRLSETAPHLSGWVGEGEVWRAEVRQDTNTWHVVVKEPRPSDDPERSRATQPKEVERNYTRIHRIDPTMTYEWLTLNNAATRIYMPDLTENGTKDVIPLNDIAQWGHKGSRTHAPSWMIQKQKEILARMCEITHTLKEHGLYYAEDSFFITPSGPILGDLGSFILTEVEEVDTESYIYHMITNLNKHWNTAF